MKSLQQNIKQVWLCADTVDFAAVMSKWKAYCCNAHKNSCKHGSNFDTATMATTMPIQCPKPNQAVIPKNTWIMNFSKIGQVVSNENCLQT